MKFAMSYGTFEVAIPAVRRWTLSALGLVFPPCCSFCDRPLDVDGIDPQLCRDCVTRVFTPNTAGCPRCGAYGVKISEVDGNCLECRTTKMAIEGVISLGRYEGPLQAAVVRMKYAAGEPLAAAAGKRLGELLGCSGLDDPPDLLTCMPKYWLKRLLTGVNSAEIIMSGLGKQSKLPMAEDLLVCRRRISKQSMLSPDQRRRNVRGAWAVSQRYDIADAHIMIVDDIMTTGATANEAAMALKRSGAKRVTLAVVGRATKSQ